MVCRAALGIVGEIVESNLAVSESKVGNDVMPGYDFEHREACDISDNVSEELQLRRRVPRFLQDDVFQAVAHEFADARCAVDMRNDLQDKLDVPKLRSTSCLSAARCL